MRLLDPTNGIKTIQGHWVTNIVFFVVMMSLNKDITVTPPPAVTDQDSPEAHSAISRLQTNDQDLYLIQEDYLSLSGGGGHHEKKEWADMDAQEKMEIKDHESRIFHIMMYGHLIGAIMVLFTFRLKKNQHYNMAQFIQAVLIISVYVIAWQSIYTVKVNLSSWDKENTNDIRIWLYIEAQYMFTWIGASMIFVTLAQVFKFQSSLKSDEDLVNDQNVWNDRQSDDFLRYIKYDFFVIVYIITMALMDLGITFGAAETITKLDPEGFEERRAFDKRGKNVGIITGLILSIRVMQILTNIIRLRMGTQFEKKIKESRGLQIYIGITQLYSLSVWGIVVYLYNNKIEEVNPITKLWIFAEILAIGGEFPYTAFLGWEKHLASKPTLSVKEQSDEMKSLNVDKVQEMVFDLQKKKEMEEKLLQSKKVLEYEEDFFAMTVLCYLKSNTEKYLIHESKQAQMFYSCLVVNGIVNGLLICMIYAIIINDGKDTSIGGQYTPNIAHSFAVWFVKFPCTLALHFVLYPEVANGMNLMKFANNQPHLFVNNGSEISFILGFCQVQSALFCEGICIYMLTYQHTVQHCIIHFVALEVIMEVGNLYFESLKQNHLKGVMHHAPIAEKRGDEIKFMERSCFHKFARIWYKMFRMLYVGVVFYFIPFAVMYLQWMTVISDSEAHH